MCSLAAFKNILNCKQVTKDSNKNFYAISLFLDKVLDSHLGVLGEQLLVSTTTEQQGKHIHSVFTCYPTFDNLFSVWE